MESYSSPVHQAFDGPASPLFSCQCWHVGKEAMVMAPPPTHDSAVSPCFHGCPAFFLSHFTPQSSPSHPFDPSLHSQQEPLPSDCSTIPKLQLPAIVPSRVRVSLSRVCMAASRTVILIPFRVPQITCFTFSLKCFSSDSDNCPNVGIRPLFQFPHQLIAGPVLPC